MNKFITYTCKLALILVIGLLAMDAQAQHPSSIIDLESTTKGMLAPRMTTADRIALPGINTPAAGLLVYDTETMTFWYWDDMKWNEIASGDTSAPFMGNGGNVMSGDTIRAADTVMSTITLFGPPDTITAETDVKVCLDITHTWVGDITAILTAPDGTTTVELASGNGSSGDNYRITCFSDDATISINSGSAPFNGTYRPEQPLSGLVGQTINGDWTLSIRDSDNADDGILHSWSIQIGTGGAAGQNPAELSDVDGDTKIQVEALFDEDVIRFTTGGASAMQINSSGNVAMGTKFATGYRLSVDGKIATEEVLVNLDGDWPDYVFHKNYELRSLPQLEAYIAQYGHLPNIPTAEEIKRNGLTLGESNRVLTEKIEELTLYLIEADKKNAALEARVQALESNKKRRFRK
jgi:subtilisin-like proprotein convertase family protein